MIEIEDEEGVDFLCVVCDTLLVLGARQEFGQQLTTRMPLVVYGECPTCGEIYTTIYQADIEETGRMACDNYVT